MVAGVNTWEDPKEVTRRPPTPNNKGWERGEGRAGRFKEPCPSHHRVWLKNAYARKHLLHTHTPPTPHPPGFTWEKPPPLISPLPFLSYSQCLPSVLPSSGPSTLQPSSPPFPGSRGHYFLGLGFFGRYTPCLDWEA